ATTSVKGIVELATDAEAIAGTDGTRAVTPAAAKAATAAAAYSKTEIDARVAHDSTGHQLRSPNGSAGIRADNSGVIFSGNIYATSVTGSGSYRAVYANQNGAIGYVPSLQALKELSGVQGTDVAAWLALDLRRFFYKGDESE